MKVFSVPSDSLTFPVCICSFLFPLPVYLVLYISFYVSCALIFCLCLTSYSVSYFFCLSGLLSLWLSARPLLSPPLSCSTFCPPCPQSFSLSHCLPFCLLLGVNIFFDSLSGRINTHILLFHLLHFSPFCCQQGRCNNTPKWDAGIGDFIYIIYIIFVTSAGDKSVSLLLEWHIKRCLKENKSPGFGMVMIHEK